MKKKNDTLLKVLKYIRHYLGLLILSLVFAAITVALTLYVPILIGNGVDCIICCNYKDYCCCFIDFSFAVAYEYMQ